MDTNRHRRIRAAAIEAEHKNHDRDVQRVLEAARRHVRASGGVRYTDPVETPRSSLVFKTHDPNEQRSQQVHCEPAVAAASHLAAEGDDRWAGWERWLRSHLDSEREVTEAAIRVAITNAVRDVVDGTLAAFDALDENVLKINRELRGEIHDLKIEVARLTSVLTVMREERANAPLDLPKLPLRTAREVN
jgi:hypothetical protein